MLDFFDSDGINRRTSIRRALLVSMVAVGLSAISVANAEVFRYQQDGSVTYGDYVPTIGLDSGHSVLSSQGVVLKQVKSREERRVDRRKEQEAKVLRVRDKTLLKTFTAEEDLFRTRDDRLGLVDDQISRLDESIRISKEKLISLDLRIRSSERSEGAGKAPSNLYEEQDRVNKKIEHTWALIDSKSAARKKIASRFEADLVRYRWLKSAARSNY